MEKLSPSPKESGLKNTHLEKIPRSVTLTILFHEQTSREDFDTSTQIDHNWKTECCNKVITEKPGALRS